MKLQKPLNLSFTYNNEPDSVFDLTVDEKNLDQLHSCIKKLQTDLLNKNQQLDFLKEEYRTLEIINNKLEVESKNNQARQNLLEAELKKAEAQIDLIMKLFNKS